MSHNITLAGVMYILFYCFITLGAHEVPTQVESKSANSSFDDGQEPEDDIIHDLLSKLEPPKVCLFVIVCT